MNNYLEALHDLTKTDEETLYVFDSNYLAYAMQSIKYSDRYFEAMDEVKERMYIPYIVYMETVLNLKNYMQNTEHLLRNINGLILSIEETNMLFNTETTELSDFLRNKIESKIDKKALDLMKGNINYKGVDGFKSLIDEKVHEIAKALKDEIMSVNTALGRKIEKVSETLEDEKKTYCEEDFQKKEKSNLRKLNEILSNGKIVGEEYTQEYINTKSEIISEQIGKGLVPGSKDAGKDNGGTRKFGGLEYNKSYGDAILWHDMIDFVKQDKCKNVVIVSDDVKTDWSESKGSSRLRDNLVIFFIQQTSKSIRRMKSSEFIKSILKLGDNEVDEISEEILYFESPEEMTTLDTMVISIERLLLWTLIKGGASYYICQIENNRVPYIKNVAFYQKYPVSKITHIGKVKGIIPVDIDQDMYKIVFEDEIRRLDTPIPLGEEKNALQESRFVELSVLENASNIDEILFHQLKYDHHDKLG